MKKYKIHIEKHVSVICSFKFTLKFINNIFVLSSIQSFNIISFKKSLNYLAKENAIIAQIPNEKCNPIFKQNKRNLNFSDNSLVLNLS